MRHCSRYACAFYAHGTVLAISLVKVRNCIKDQTVIGASPRTRKREFYDVRFRGVIGVSRLLRRNFPPCGQGARLISGDPIKVTRWVALYARRRKYALVKQREGKAGGRKKRVKKRERRGNAHRHRRSATCGRNNGGAGSRCGSPRR